MATWGDLVDHIKHHYDIAREADGVVQLGFRTESDRTHMVVVSRIEYDEREWAQIESPIGPVDRVDLAEAARLLGDAVCGGLAVLDDMALLRHTVLLAHLDPPEFELPMHLVVATADHLEQALAGGDDY